MVLVIRHILFCCFLTWYRRCQEPAMERTDLRPIRPEQSRLIHRRVKNTWHCKFISQIRRKCYFLFGPDSDKESSVTDELSSLDEGRNPRESEARHPDAREMMNRIKIIGNCIGAAWNNQWMRGSSAFVSYRSFLRPVLHTRAALQRYRAVTSVFYLD